MEFDIWHYWLIAAILFGILEIFIPSFIVLNFGVGALFATVAAAFDMSTEWQIAIFAVGSLVSFFVVRPLMIKYGFKKSDNVKTNVDAMSGRTGKVTERIDNEANTGRAAIDGDDWRAKTLDGSIIEPGVMVEVEKIESIIIYVKPIK